MSLTRGLVYLCLFVSFSSAFAQFDEAGFKQALKIKKDAYTAEGTVSGGDRAVSNFDVHQIRIAKNPAGYDRIVVDLQGSEGGSSTQLTYPPFFLVENSPSNKEVIVTLYGNPKLNFSRQIATQQAKKTKYVSKVEFLPVVDSDRWTWLIHTQVPVKAEVFELSTPARLIIDLRP